MEILRVENLSKIYGSGILISRGMLKDSRAFSTRV